MQTLDPRGAFLKDQSKVQKFRSFIDDPVFVEAMQGSLVEFSLENHTQEETKGANAFLRKFLNFTEIPKEIRSWPDHSRIEMDEHAPKTKNKS